ncbi:hypothetical protein Q9233_011322 [Columba guinea]|nr:hypothetical protein Q9233_011322 [Columba guinea]
MIHSRRLLDDISFRAAPCSVVHSYKKPSEAIPIGEKETSKPNQPKSKNNDFGKQNGINQKENPNKQNNIYFCHGSSVN